MGILKIELLLRSGLYAVICAPALLFGQLAQESLAPVVKDWPAALYWQPAAAESASARVGAITSAVALPLGSNALVFVAMTPCRIVDTRAGQGFGGSFGPPSLVRLTSRTFPIQTNTTCPVPSLARAYSFNVTVVPSGPLGYLTIYPTGQTRPLAATLNALMGQVVGNAAIAPAGTPNGSVDIYVDNNTDLIIDMNGYYANPTDLNHNTGLGSTALASDTTGSGNTATGSFALANNTTGSNNTATGNLALSSNQTASNNTAMGASALYTNSGDSNTALGANALTANTSGYANTSVGTSALAANTTGYGSVALGYQALQSATGTRNIGVGLVGGIEYSEWQQQHHDRKSGRLRRQWRDPDWRYPNLAFSRGSSGCHHAVFERCRRGNRFQRATRDSEFLGAI